MTDNPLYTNNGSATTGLTNTSNTIVSTSGTLRPGTANADCFARINTSIGVDQYIEADLIIGASDPGGPFTGLFLGGNTGDDGRIRVQTSGDIGQLRVVTDGAAGFNFLGFIDSGFALSHTYRFRAEKIAVGARLSIIKVYRDATLLGSVWCPFAVNGLYTGLEFFYSTGTSLMQFDNVEAGNFVSDAAPGLWSHLLNGRRRSRMDGKNLTHMQ